MFFIPEKKPQSASIVITTKCNARCSICKIWAQTPVEIELSEVKRIVLDLKSFGINTINLLGGEALLYKSLFDLAAFIKNEKLKCTLITNGVLINDKNISDIKTHFDYVAVSIDGSAREVYENTRPGLSFEKVVNSIKLLKQHNVIHDIRYTIQSKNISDIPGIIEFAKTCGTKVLFGFAESRGIGNSEIEDFNDIKASQLLAYSNILKSPVVINKSKTFEIIAKRLAGGTVPFRCRSPYNYIFIYASQDVYPCSVIDDSMGNLKNSTIKEIFYSEKFKKTRANIKKSKLTICKSCLHGCEIDASL